MKKFRLKNTLAGIAATVVALSFGYLAVQYLGKHMMIVISAGMCGLSIAVHQMQKSSRKKYLPKTTVVTETQPNLTRLEKKVKKQDNASITTASKSFRHGSKIIKVTSKPQSYGYCRKRLALCHRAKIEAAKKYIPKD